MKKLSTLSIILIVLALLPISIFAQGNIQMKPEKKQPKIKMEPVKKQPKIKMKPVNPKPNVKMKPVNEEPTTPQIKRADTKNDTLFVQYLGVDTKIWKTVRPAIQLFFLRSKPSLLDEAHKDYNNPFIGEFARANAGEIKLGTVIQKWINIDEAIAKYGFSGLFFKYMGPNEYMANSPDRDQYNLKLIQGGVSSTSGYGYQAKDSWFGIYLYTGGGFNWSDVSYTIATGGDRTSNEALNTFDDGIRFGQTWESGLRISLIGPLNIIGGFEQNIIYPRHLFWKWAISGLIEGVSISLLDAFAHSIMQSTPAAGPIVNWALKTGANFLIYHLRSKNMNWPFETAPPLVINSWKIGLSLEF